MGTSFPPVGNDPAPRPMNRRERRAYLRQLPKRHAPIKRAMKGIYTGRDAVALAASRGL